jgi:hypothetical protein
MLTYRATYKTLDDLNQDEMRLGGLRINLQQTYLAQLLISQYQTEKN